MRRPADKMDMDQSAVFEIVKRVFESSEVIGVTIALILYVNFVSYVARYRKKKKIVQKKRRTTAAPSKPAPLSEPSDDDESPGGLDGDDGDILV